MLIAEVVIQTLPGRAAWVADRVRWLGTTGAVTLEGNARLRATLRVPEYDTIEGLAEAVQSLDADILAVYPAFVEVDLS